MFFVRVLANCGIEINVLVVNHRDIFADEITEDMKIDAHRQIR